MTAQYAPKHQDDKPHSTDAASRRIMERQFPLTRMSFIQDFRQFAMKGNVVDMAVGVIIGGAFGKIVSSLVGDVIMPAIGIILGKVNFSELSIVVGSATIAYGKFIQSVVDFVIVALVIFLVIKQITRFRRQPEPVDATPPAPPEDIKLLTEIRDLLKKA